MEAAAIRDLSEASVYDGKGWSFLSSCALCEIIVSSVHACYCNGFILGGLISVM